jgi:hypothetical protein
MDGKLVVAMAAEMALCWVDSLDELLAATWGLCSVDHLVGSWEHALVALTERRWEYKKVERMDTLRAVLRDNSKDRN